MPGLIGNPLRVSPIAKLGNGLAPWGVDNMVSDVGHDFDINAARD